MRIVYLTQSYPPMISGAALVVEKLATGMAARGHHVLVIAASDRAEPYTVREKNLTVVRLRSVHNPARVNQRFLLLPHFAVTQALNAFQPDIIHVHEPLQTAWAGMLYARRHRIPLTLTAHQTLELLTEYLPNHSSIRSAINSVITWYASWFIKQFPAVITPSRTTARQYHTLIGIQPATISNGIDLQTFFPASPSDVGPATRQKLNLPADAPIILHVGRLDLEKHVDRLILACAPALRTTSAHLLIVGDGCQKERLISLTRELGIADRVHFAGFIARANLPEIYRLATIFVNASEIEAQGIVLLEAAASELPIVAVNSTCIPEIVHDRVNGFLAEPGDLDTMSAGIMNLLSNPRKARMMGREGRFLAEEHDIQQSWSLYEKLYRELINQARLRGAPHLAPRQRSREILKAWIEMI